MTMSPEEMEQIVGLALEKLDRIHDRQDATARAVRDLASGLTNAESRHQREAVDIGKLEAAILTLSPDKAELLSTVTAHEVADFIAPETVNKGRAIQWARKQGQPEPLPDTPDELVPVHVHHRKDDSIQFRTDAHGDAVMKANVKVKTLFGWAIAAVLGGLHVWRLIVDALHNQ